ncbi:hypothetical protein PFISCL1PPCAC_18285, partial [Pristionchus fissidentatus]
SEFPGMENHQLEKRSRIETTSTNLLDLPDEIIEIIISHLDLASRNRIRVNRRLNEIESKIKMEKESEGIWKDVKIYWLPSRTVANVVFDTYRYQRNDIRSNSDLSVESCERIVRNVKFGYLEVSMDFEKKSQFELMEKLRFASAETLWINRYDIEVKRTDKINFPFVRDLIKGMEFVHINLVCTSFSFDEISILRENIRESASGRLTLHVTHEMAISLMDQWMGVNFCSLIDDLRLSSDGEKSEK